jgi:hypothetical protein
LIVFGFLGILLTTFVVVIAMTGRSPQEQIVAQRMALIHSSARREAGAIQDAQLLKMIRRGRFGWLDEILSPYAFAQKLQSRILQANSSTTVATLILTSAALFMAGYAMVWSTWGRARRWPCCPSGFFPSSVRAT